MSRVEPAQDPRIAKKEMIITRFKSAQQKKQKEKHDQPIETTKPFGLKIHKSTSKTTNMSLKIANSLSKMAKSPQTVTKEPTVAKLQETTKSIPKNKPSKKAKPKSTAKQKETTEAKSPILIEDDYPEYYPEKTKRAPGNKKVFLKPKQKSTMIARTNKRKFNTPKRGVKSPLPNQSTFSSDVEPANNQSPYSELSMAEVIRIMEENDSLDDEDLMEILTCPSPVWWEEPPDEMYIEEAICSRQPEESPAGKTKSPIRERCLNTLRKSANFGGKTKSQNITATTLNDISAEVTKNDKFIKKSKKLENVLGNIKNKACKSNDLDGKSIKQEKPDEQTTANKQTESENVTDHNCDSNVTDASENISVTDNDATESTSVDVKDVKIENEESNKRKTKLSESTEDSCGDMNARNQELLLDLENMNIPIEVINSPDCVIINDDNCNKIIDVDAADAKLDNNENHDVIKEDANNCSNTNEEINGVDSTSNNNNTEQESQDNTTEICNNVDEEQNLVPKELPPLIKCPKIENNVFASPNSYKSISDDITESSSISGIDMMDTISDTNIKFITDDDIDDVSDGDNKNKNDEGDKNEISDLIKNNSVSKSDDKITELNELAVLTKNEPKSKDSYITVLKILPKDESTQKPKNKFKNIPEYSSYVENLIQSETKPEITDESLENEIPDVPDVPDLPDVPDVLDVPDTKGQLNSFYKKCKNVNRKRKRIEVVDKIEMTESECKSSKKSITVAQEENVKYCLKCSSIFDTEDCSYCLKSDPEPEKTYMCDKCDFVGETSNASEHLEEHNIEEDEKT